MPSVLVMGVLIALGFSGNILSDTQGDRITLSFDSMFPATPYKDALGSCMQLLGYLDQLCHEHEIKEMIDVMLLHDAFLGKAVQAQYKVGHLVERIKTGHVVSDDNVDYLNTLLEHINKRYAECINTDRQSEVTKKVLYDMSYQVSHIGEL